MAKILGYTEPRKAIARHVDSDDGMKHPLTDSLKNRLQEVQNLDHGSLKNRLQEVQNLDGINTNIINTNISKITTTNTVSQVSRITKSVAMLKCYKYQL